jgi:hypothetical protein
MLRLVTSLKKAKMALTTGLEPAAWTYFDAIGKIWLQEIGSYFESSGKIALYIDTGSFSVGGAYFNRQ